MTSKEIRDKFLNFFKQRGHAVVPSSSLIPGDPSVLLTTAGMQQFKPYFLGKADPVHDFGTRRTASIQKSFRTSDIDEVGDESHLTFFEMLGHFSFGDYFKKETIEWTYEFLTTVLKISPERIWASVFEGDDAIPFDQESYDAWLRFIPEKRIKKGGREGNVWGPPGPEGPCGAANEVYVDDLEVATLVFMEYYCAQDGSLSPLADKGVDVGWGLERAAKVIQNASTVFDTDLFLPFMELLPADLEIRIKRIVTDHLRAVAFLLADGLRPSNKEAGYILRRLLRRALVYEHIYKVPQHVFDAVIHDIVHEYGEFYPELLRENENIRQEFNAERQKFGSTLQRGLKELERVNTIDGTIAFNLYETFGLPYEIIKELGGARAQTLSHESFDGEFRKHQEISRAGQEKKFGGHGLLLDTGELKAGNEEELKTVTRLHTATHLLNAALHKVLGNTVEQRGSDITPERTRFDFLFPRKLTGEELKKIEELVNYAIAKDFPVSAKEMSLEEAKKSGALFFYEGHYPERVKVYTIGDDKEIFSQELCGGPHVTHTGEIGHFKIVKEESSSFGVRRIRGVID
ncbi:MAG: alanine--tRNA ligase [Candidatus Sungiibacteriota bacterium]|uniref:alanine--tRNA ligase n=1 Tax=Candidatus Sungiibacteriota bacterium TaxID=2750080 RepID=A0A7T5URN3_9BACT|nr:MAG: alanine--tRNA ligase [Candidatus Sungbacteria bacterium]